MSQAMLMRIITLEKRVAELEAKLVPIVSWSTIGDPSDFSPGEDVSVHDMNELPYTIIQHGASWWRVFGPEGEVTEKGLRRHEAQALADDLNRQAG